MYFPSDYFISIPFVLFFCLMHKKEDGDLTDQSLCPCPYNILADSSATDRDMITVLTKECNEISRKIYDTIIDSIRICQLKCSSVYLYRPWMLYSTHILYQFFEFTQNLKRSLRFCDLILCL